MCVEEKQSIEFVAETLTPLQMSLSQTYIPACMSYTCPASNSQNLPQH